LTLKFGWKIAWQKIKVTIWKKKSIDFPFFHSWVGLLAEIKLFLVPIELV
jgi:hypothetical protein